MTARGEKLRFWLPVVLLGLMTAYTGYKLVRAHVCPTGKKPKYEISYDLPARRGGIYASYCHGMPLSISIPYWEYRLDPVALTNGASYCCNNKGRSVEAIIKTISDLLPVDRATVRKMCANTKNRYQVLGVSSSERAHAALTNRQIVPGIRSKELYTRKYLQGRRLCHVLGSVNTKGIGSYGIEERYQAELQGVPGQVEGMQDGIGGELYEKRTVSVEPTPGSDVYLTIEPNIQDEAEKALSDGVAEYGAAAGWSIVMNARTGAILAMASLPDYDPLLWGDATEDMRLNRAVGFNYEPGSVMKVITVAAAIDAGFTSPNRMYRTNRDDPDYYHLPGDGSHVWEPLMSVRDAIVHSSNIVIGKLAYDFGPKRLHAYMQRFGFGRRTGIELPREECGILRNPNNPKTKWDNESRSRAGIGQFVSVTAIQLVSAYQAIANDGVRMQPYIVDKVVRPDGTVAHQTTPFELGRPISAKTARTMREMMLGVASPEGTARRAAIRGYSVAGKTGTAQKVKNKRYADGLYRATFIGITPASDPKVVVLVTLDFEERTRYHQGGNSAGPVFKRIARAALRYLAVPEDRPEEVDDEDDEAYVRQLRESYSVPSSESNP